MKDTFPRLWAITQGSYSDYHIIAVCEDEATAKIWADACKSSREPYRDDVEIEEFPFIPKGSEPQVYETWFARCDLDEQGISNERIHFTRDFVFTGNPPDHRPRATYWYRDYQGENKYELSITGATEESVLKALSDRKARWLACDRDLAKYGDTVYGLK